MEPHGATRRRPYSKGSRVPPFPIPLSARTLVGMNLRDRILVNAAPAELRPDRRGVVDVYAALERQFFWADTVIVGLDDGDLAEDELEVLEGEVVA